MILFKLLTLLYLIFREHNSVAFRAIFLIMSFLTPFAGLSQSLCDTTSACAGTIRVQSLSQYYTACLGDSVEVSLMFCFTTETQIDTSVEVILSLPGNSTPGFTLGSGPFSGAGTANLNLVGMSDCVELVFFVHVDTSATPGDVVSIPVSVGIPPAFCSQIDSIFSTINLLIVDCARSECLCPDEPGNVNLNGALLHESAGGAGFPQPN